MERDWQDRVDAFWHRVFGADSSQSGPVITKHRASELSGYPGIYAIQRLEAIFISAPPDLTEPIRNWNPTVATVIDPTWWRCHLPDWPILGPSVHAFTSEPPPVAIAPPGRHIEPIAPDQLFDLHLAVDPTEWGESGFAGDDVELAWRVTDSAGRTIAAANLTPFDGFPTDVGVLTTPSARGVGAATAVASVAARYAVETFGIARWRALTINPASLRIAQRLRFQTDCLQIALRPPPP